MTKTPFQLINTSRAFLFLNLILSISPTSIKTVEPIETEKSSQQARGFTVTLAKGDDDLDDDFGRIDWHESDKPASNSLWDYTSSLATKFYDSLPGLPRPWSGGAE